MICVLKDFPNEWNAWSKEKGVLMAYHQLASSCQKQGSFHSFEHMKNESLFQFTWSCEIIAWLCETDVDNYNNFMSLDNFASACEFSYQHANFCISMRIFAWQCENFVECYNKIELSWPIRMYMWIFTWLCQTLLKEESSCNTLHLLV